MSAPLAERRRRWLRALTFWLRPGFVLRTINRFQKIAGFDRAIALASSALTALIPLVILTGSIIEARSDAEAGDWIIERYELSGAGARAVRDVFSPVDGSTEGASAVGGVLMLLAILSFTRTFQRLFEQSWELAPLSVRNTLNGLRWIVAFAAYAIASAVIHALLAQDGADVVANVAIAPLTAVFLIWSGWTLSARRIGRSELWPFGVLAAILLAAYSLVAARYVPPQVSSYAEHYGVLGVVLAAISTLFCVMVVIAGCAALGREVRDELARIRSGRRPPDGEVRREWANIVAEARSRWEIARGFVDRLRDHGDRSGQDG